MSRKAVRTLVGLAALSAAIFPQARPAQADTPVVLAPVVIISVGATSTIATLAGGAMGGVASTIAQKAIDWIFPSDNKGAKQTTQGEITGTVSSDNAVQAFDKKGHNFFIEKIARAPKGFDLHDSNLFTNKGNKIVLSVKDGTYKADVKSAGSAYVEHRIKRTATAILVRPNISSSDNVTKSQIAVEVTLKDLLLSTVDDKITQGSAFFRIIVTVDGLDKTYHAEAYHAYGRVIQGRKDIKLDGELTGKTLKVLMPGKAMINTNSDSRKFDIPKTLQKLRFTIVFETGGFGILLK